MESYFKILYFKNIISKMQKYQIIKKLGEGSFGNVDKAQNVQTKQMVAIKQLKKKYGTWEQCLQLLQVKALRKIVHPNIIKLKQLVRVVNDAYLIFEFYDRDLLKLINERKEKGKKLSEQQIRLISKQIAQGLSCIHRQGYFHRDIKPQNILITENMEAKIIDFGIAKEIRTQPPFTEYISTRWYRAPELLFKFPTYSAPVDIFALGCLVAEMYLAKPLFQGNSQMDQISKICSIMGSPSLQNWPQGFKHASKKGINFPEYSEILLPTVITNCPKDALDFILECIRWDPSKRMTASQLVDHPFLNVQSSKLIKQISINSYVAKQIKSPLQRKKNIPIFDKDDQFDELLNNFATAKITSAKNIQDQQGDW